MGSHSRWTPSLGFGFCLLLLLGGCGESAESRSGQDDDDDEAATAAAAAAHESQEERAMLGALQEVLEKLKDHCLPPMEKKPSWVPLCIVGQHCAVRKGSRIGLLCTCPRGTSCNLYILRCL